MLLRSDLIFLNFVSFSCIFHSVSLLNNLLESQLKSCVPEAMRNPGGVCEFRSENKSANDEGKMLRCRAKI